MPIHCANCYEAKIFLTTTQTPKGNPIHKVRCRHGHWRKDTRKHTDVERTVRVNNIKEIHPPMKHSCVDYQSMGDGVKSFLADLPESKDDYVACWLGVGNV